MLVVGTIVTGSGPHAGDLKARRFGFSPQVISWIHADLVIALTITVFITYLLLKNESGILRKRTGIFLLIILSQGAVGYFQYFTGLPELIVGVHLLGSTLVWIAAWSLFEVVQIKFITGKAVK